MSWRWSEMRGFWAGRVVVWVHVLGGSPFLGWVYHVFSGVGWRWGVAGIEEGDGGLLFGVVVVGLVDRGCVGGTGGWAWSSMVGVVFPCEAWVDRVDSWVGGTGMVGLEWEDCLFFGVVVLALLD